MLLSNYINAQTLAEAVQYSHYNYVGTARTAGAGGAFGALGGDQGAIAINPATLGTYKKGEFVISPTYFSSSTETNFQDNRIQDNPAVDITAVNMGLVFSSRNANSKWNTSNIAISYNKMTDFERNIRFRGISEGSIVTRFAERANGKDLNDLDDFEAGLAYDALALIGPDDSLQYTTDLLPGQNIDKSQSIRSDGGMSQLSIAWSGNYKNKVQLGFELGIPFVRYSVTKSYNEAAVDNSSPFRTLSYSESLETSGSGINFSMGIILIPVNSLRIGASIKSPTSFTLDDTYSTSINYSYNDGGSIVNGSKESPPGSFSYNFITPWKTTGSIAYILQTNDLNGFLSLDLDYIDYTSANFDLLAESNNNADLILQDDLNNQINNQLKNGINLRFGGELAYDIYRVRAGYQMNSSPYYEDEGKFFNGFTLGAGLRFDKFFFDVAYKLNTIQQGYIPYVTTSEQDLQLVNQETSNVYFATTFGLKF